MPDSPKEAMCHCRDECFIDTSIGPLGRIGCVLVHHNNLGDLEGTVRSMVGEGVLAANLLVVDNSGDAVTDLDLEAAVPCGVNVVRIENMGYAHAVNFGIDWLTSTVAPDFVLVVTHEVRLRSGALTVLLEALLRDDQLAAVGPMLETIQSTGQVWVAAGGSYGPVFGIPRHNVIDGGSVECHSETVCRCEWLDGAFVLYRAEAVVERRMREDFFLYVEEVEFHARLREEVGEIACVPGAYVTEKGNEPPARLRSRNLQWFFDLHGNWFQRCFSVPWMVGRNFVRFLVGRATWRDFRDGFAGWLDALKVPIEKRPAGPASAVDERA